MSDVRCSSQLDSFFQSSINQRGSRVEEESSFEPLPVTGSGGMNVLRAESHQCDGMRE